MANQNRRAGKQTRLLAMCAMLAALGVVLLYLGSFIEVLDLSVALVASLAVIVLVIEKGGWYPWLVYSVTSVLALLLLPNKFPAVVYAFFMGFYPILKEKAEKIRVRVIGLVIKLILFNLSLGLMWLIGQWLLGEMNLGMPIVAVVGVLNAIFLFYDYALSVMITAYLRVWRKKLRVERFFQ